MDYNYEPGELISAITNFMQEKKPDYDFTFITSLQSQLERKGELSPKQISALERIIDGFHIDMNEWGS